jgi:hypothetical protein
VSVSSCVFTDDMQGNEKGVDQGIGTQRSGVVSMRVKCSSKTDTPETVLNFLRGNANFPGVGRVYAVGNSRNTGMFCKSLQVNRVKNSEPATFDVKATFEPSSVSLQVEKQDGQGRPSTNPFTWRHEIQTSSYAVTVPAESGTFRGYYPPGAKGNKLGLNAFGPIVNSAFETFDPTLEREVHIHVIRITKYAAALLPATYDGYIGTVNNDNVTINKLIPYRFLYTFAPYKGKIKAVDHVFDIANGIPYYRQTLELHVNPLGWRHYVLDKGTQELFGAQEKMDGVTVSNSDVGEKGYISRRILDPRGNPVVGLLDGNGQLLKKGQVPRYLIYQIDSEAPFSPIRW